MSTGLVWALVVVAAYIFWRTSRVLRKLADHETRHV